jgi:hypothetical protein
MNYSTTRLHGSLGDITEVAIAKLCVKTSYCKEGQKPWGKVMEQIISLYSRLIKCGRIRENCVWFALNL